MFTIIVIRIKDVIQLLDQVLKINKLGLNIIYKTGGQSAVTTCINNIFGGGCGGKEIN